MTSNRCVLALGVLSRGIVIDCTSVGLPKLTIIVGVLPLSGKDTPLVDVT